MKWLFPVLIGTMLLIGATFFVTWAFLAEENTRGSHEWDATLDRLRATGQPVEFQRLIPPPVPDAANLAMIPLFQSVSTPSGRSSQEKSALQAALQNIQGDPGLPAVGGWLKGQPADPAKLAEFVTSRYQKVFPVGPNARTSLQQFDEVPRDLINGQPFHYQLRPDGAYVLYSVGWNEVDDGGKVAYKSDDPRQTDREHGDWVWPSFISNPK